MKRSTTSTLEYILDVTDERAQKQAADEKINNLNTIPTPIMSIDTDFNITYMNPAGAAVAGKNPDECVGNVLGRNVSIYLILPIVKLKNVPVLGR